jgi:hypothetical protein
MVIMSQPWDCEELIQVMLYGREGFERRSAGLLSWSRIKYDAG